LSSSPAPEIFGDRLPLARRYAELLADTGVSHGLIGPREVPRIWDRHILNCAVLAPLIGSGRTVADVGSGAGLPGLVLAVARPDLRITLVEPLLRRVSWLQQAIDDLGLGNVTVVRSRAGEVTDRFDVVTARAVAALPQLLEWCLPLAVPGGTFLALKGGNAATELQDAAPTLQRLGAASAAVESVGAGVVDPPATVVRVVAGKTLPVAPVPRRPARRRRP
jgi:16S rRNA (guanine527-N7)-methyltransferase